MARIVYTSCFCYPNVSSYFIHPNRADNNRYKKTSLRMPNERSDATNWPGGFTRFTTYHLTYLRPPHNRDRPKSLRIIQNNNILSDKSKRWSRSNNSPFAASQTSCHTNDSLSILLCFSFSIILQLLGPAIFGPSQAYWIDKLSAKNQPNKEKTELSFLEATLENIIYIGYI